MTEKWYRVWFPFVLTAVMLLGFSGCGSFSGGSPDKALVSQKVAVCLERIQQKDWAGLYRDGGMSVVSETSLGDFVAMARYDGFWSLADGRVTGYEIAKIYDATKSLTQKNTKQIIAKIKIFGTFRDGATQSGLMMVFVKTDSDWNLFSVTEVPRLTF